MMSKHFTNSPGKIIAGSCAILFVALVFFGGYFIRPAVYSASAGKANSVAAFTGETIKIKAGDDIRDILENAPDNSNVIVGEGTYKTEDSISLKGKKNISVTGEGEVWIICGRIDRKVIALKDCSGMLLKNIKACHRIEDSSYKVPENSLDRRNGSVADVEDCEGITFENCELEGCGVVGVYSVNSGSIELRECYLHHNSWRAFAFHNTSGVSDVVIKDCRIVNNSGVIEVEGNVNVRYEGKNIMADNNEEGYRKR